MPAKKTEFQTLTFVRFVWEREKQQVALFGDMPNEYDALLEAEKQIAMYEKYL